MKMLNRLVVAAALALTSQFALALEAPKIYVGGAGGVTHINTQGTGNFNISEDDAGWKVFGGIMPFSWLGLELSYHDFGEFDTKVGTTKFTVEDISAVTLSLVPAFSINEWFGVFARLGLSFWELDEIVEDFFKDKDGDSGMSVLYGLGPRITINEHFAIEAAWERLYANGDDYDLYSLGIRVSTK